MKTACGKPLPTKDNYPSYAVVEELEYIDLNSFNQVVKANDEYSVGYIILNSLNKPMQIVAKFINMEIELSPMIEPGKYFVWSESKPPKGKSDLVYHGLGITLDLGNNVEISKEGFQIPYTDKNTLVVIEAYDLPDGTETLSIRKCFA